MDRGQEVRETTLDDSGPVGQSAGRPDWTAFSQENWTKCRGLVRAHCLGEISNSQSQFQYSLSYFVYNQYTQDFGNAGYYPGCYGSLYFNGTGWVHWVS